MTENLPERVSPPSTDITDPLIAALTHANDRRAELAEAGDWESLGWGLDRLTEIHRQLSELVAAIESDVYELMPEKRGTIDHLGTLEKKRGSNRKKWQSDRLVTRLVRAALDPEGTGELPDSPYEAVDTVVSTLTACAPFTGSMGWRVTALKERGIDPDEWCESTPGRQSIQIHKATLREGES